MFHCMNNKLMGAKLYNLIQPSPKKPPPKKPAYAWDDEDVT